MEKIVLHNQTSDGSALEATFSVTEGLNLVSFKKGDIEFIEQSQGALIGPHYGNRINGIIPSFPDIPNTTNQSDPFFQGIGRYAPWQVENTENTIKASLNGKQEWMGQPLAKLEGQVFTLSFKANLTSSGLKIIYSVVSESDSVVGLDYHFRLPEGRGTVISDVKDYYLENKEPKTVPSSWTYDANRNLSLDLDRNCNYTFYPFRNPLEGRIWLRTSEYDLQMNYRCPCQENSWQVVHHKGTNSVSLGPISAKLPYRPVLTVSSLEVDLFPQ